MHALKTCVCNWTVSITKSVFLLHKSERRKIPFIKIIHLGKVCSKFHLRIWIGLTKHFFVCLDCLKFVQKLQFKKRKKGVRFLTMISILCLYLIRSLVFFSLCRVIFSLRLSFTRTNTQPKCRTGTQSIQRKSSFFFLFHLEHPFITDFYDWIGFRWVWLCIVRCQCTNRNRVMRNPSL